MDLAPDFDEFIGCLIAHGVEFLIAWRSSDAIPSYVTNRPRLVRKISPISTR